MADSEFSLHLWRGSYLISLGWDVPVIFFDESPEMSTQGVGAELVGALAGGVGADVGARQVSEVVDVFYNGRDKDVLGGTIRERLPPTAPHRSSGPP